MKNYCSNTRLDLVVYHLIQQLRVSEETKAIYYEELSLLGNESQYAEQIRTYTLRCYVMSRYNERAYQELLKEVNEFIINILQDYNEFKDVK